MDKYEIFISYRRDGAEGEAGRISDRLTQKGYKVFFDMESMRSGKFNEQIFDAIDMCSDVLVVLPPNGLDRCKNEGDWVRLEIAHALKKGKNIIPIMLRNFDMEVELPEDIAPLKMMEGITAYPGFFDAIIKRIEELLECKKGKEALPKEEAMEKVEIKIPFFLPAKEFKLRNARNFLEMWLNEIMLDMNVGREWWHFFNNVELPEDEDEFFELFNSKCQECSKKYGTVGFVRNVTKTPITLRPSTDLCKKMIIKWKNSLDNLKRIDNIPKRYKEDGISPFDLMKEISDLAQTCLYNIDHYGTEEHSEFYGTRLYSDHCGTLVYSDDCDTELYILELVILGCFLTAGYPRSNGFSFLNVVRFCLKYIFNEYEIFIAHRDTKEINVKRFLKRVSIMIKDATDVYGVYEDAAKVLNNRVKFLLKYFQLISMFLDPEYDGKMLKKYLLINYKYLKKHNVKLTQANEELFEKLINIYHNL